jgi:Putative bacterial sensory transduction regulator
MPDLKPYYDMVENCIQELGVEPIKARMPNKEGEWELTKGSITVWVSITYLEQNKTSYIQVLSPVVNVPANNILKFYEDLLETNHTLYGVAFTKYDKWIYVKAIRETEGLDQNEVFNMITRVGNYADMYDDVFWAKYSAKLG